MNDADDDGDVCASDLGDAYRTYRTCAYLIPHVSFDTSMMTVYFSSRDGDDSRVNSSA